MAGLSSNRKQRSKTTGLKRTAKEQLSQSVQQRKRKHRDPHLDLHQSRDEVNPKMMGGVHSSKVICETSQSTTPSLELWKASDGMSSETLAEAYGLGIKKTPTMLASHNDKVNHGLSSGIDIGKYVAIDCEMVGIGPGGHQSALARVSLVDFHGRQLYDSFVKQKEKVTDWRSSISGVSPRDMRFARQFEDVQNEVFSLINGRVLVGHDLRHDLDALKLTHPPKDVRDTAKHQTFKKYSHGRKPALRILARELLGVEIQQGPHSSTEDARVTMLLFRKHKSQFDIDHANRYLSKTIPIKAKDLKKSNQKISCL
ncbi:hypothetical protein UVI_02039090 [Ustilaginoidea virens]|uniref:RNA exonuclease 4 n=1 Tax=Ustilaginoidea virens TaxID=1159556 RepID=A0A1B5L865_USTVR|nr:hypothetical protein UVI_02039090 [Ustilaginoidea virens]